MYDLDISNNLFTKCLSLAAQSLRHHEQEKAYYEIIEAMRIFLPGIKPFIKSPVAIIAPGLCP